MFRVFEKCRSTDMPGYSERLDLTLGALADPTRRAILAKLRAGQLRVTEVAQPFPLSLNAISKHVRVLERAGLIRREIRGRDHFLNVDVRPLDEAQAWIAQTTAFWHERFRALETVLAAPRPRKKRRG